MKFYRFTNFDRTWWVKYRTSGMENSIVEKITDIRTSDTTDPLSLNATMQAYGLPNHLGDEVTEVGLKALATAGDLEITKQYEQGAASVLVAAPNYNTDILTFDFLDEGNDALSTDVTGVVDDGDHTVALEVPFGTTVTALIATFTLSSGATAKISSTAQVSGTTPNNFTAAKTYIITAEDGTIQNWVVTVTVAAE